MSEKQGTRRRLPRPATVLAAIAVFAVLAGTATAAKTVINGKQIKKGTITAKQIKNKTLTVNKLNPAAVSQLRGNQGARGPEGPRGPQGARGERGEQGLQGPAGIVAPLYLEKGNVNLPDKTEPTVATLAVPAAGKFLINAKVNLFAGVGVTNIECFLNAGGDHIDDISWDNSDPNTNLPVSLLAMANATPGQPIVLGCAADGGTGAAAETHISAVPVN